METFVSNGVEIAYSDFEPLGDDRREPIVLIHGFASTHAVNWMFTQWVKTLTEDGRRVVVLDNRGHGRSQKLYDPAEYALDLMAADVAHLLDHLSIARADVMGYSLGARIGTVLTLAHPDRVRSLILGGIGQYLIQDAGLPSGLAEAMEAERIEDIDNSMLKIFRGFAESTRSDLKALAACVRGARKALDPAVLSKVECPVLICVGTRDDVAGDPSPLQPLFRNARVVDIPGRDHNRAVGDRIYKQAVVEFLAQRP
ncbi:alpha/beta hydrolase [Methylocystis sp. MJC1]|jgi:pimeloyl-ACP methyl ester carboxylesterase|uniref:alpha/beta fold hydrolase n=1 Tax=Methylocystis sp. MJC1 TaxID=2654282 RepID=UPI0013ED1E25|nr:alpha/beta hydrolase [Methylocystis sp. MJC1]KAF2990213.1 3-oxoadipate enol-lactonase 2 [Methylocystis sp. MJC1]MBU6528090.1 alpha/beta hydrolase [Methylocystis sp. MJC1]UZX11007.1 alpha/beta hydrolase [Methylocystis sp. MJC1]